MMRSRFFLCLIAILVISCIDSPGIFVTSDGAIGGYDPVAYFEEGKPVKGKKEFGLKWQDANWYFSSQAHLRLFESDPSKYAPQYGGYCAYGTAEGHKAPTQPDAWTVVNDKLYLNYNMEVKQYWMQDQQRLILKADSIWGDGTSLQ